MAVWTRRLVLARYTASVDALVYVAPAGATVVVRDVIVSNSSATAVAQVTLMIRPVGAPLDVVIAVYKDLPFGTQHRDMRQAMNPGDSLRFVAQPQDLSLAVTGYVFE